MTHAVASELGGPAAGHGGEGLLRARCGSRPRRNGSRPRRKGLRWPGRWQTGSEDRHPATEEGFPVTEERASFGRAAAAGHGGPAPGHGGAAPGHGGTMDELGGTIDELGGMILGQGRATPGPNSLRSAASSKGVGVAEATAGPVNPLGGFTLQKREALLLLPGWAEDAGARGSRGRPGPAAADSAPHRIISSSGTRAQDAGLRRDSMSAERGEGLSDSAGLRHCSDEAQAEDLAKPLAAELGPASCARAFPEMKVRCGVFVGRGAPPTRTTPRAPRPACGGSPRRCS